MRKRLHKLLVLAMSLVMVLSLIGIAPIKAEAAAFDADEWWFPSVTYSVHRQTYGWEEEWKVNGETSGTVGEGKRLEGICIKVDTKDYGYDLGIEYRTHIQSYGWEEEWKADGAMSGTEGESKRLEAIQIKLTGNDAEQFSVHYRVHAQNYGWLGWAKDGEYAGTAGQSKRLEAIEIVILPSGWPPSDYDIEGSMGCAFVDIATKPSTDGSGTVSYMTHVQNYGDQKWVADGSIAGTSGESKRLEQIAIKVDKSKLGDLPGSIEYKTHVQNYGWMDWVADGEKSGTSGESKRLEGIKIRLTKQLAGYYDVYYRVHAQNYGWLGWAMNGQPAGTEGYGKRLEAIQIVVVPKGTEAPNALPADEGAEAFVSKTGSCSDTDDEDITITDKDPLYIYAANDEIKARMALFYERYPEYSNMVTVVNMGMGTTDRKYLEKIDELYKAGGEKVPSLVVADESVMHKFVSDYDYYIPMSEVGITDEEYANAYDFTKEFATIDGKLMGVAWTASPGVLMYRADIAEKVLGTSDPAKVQAYVSDWDKFMDTAEKMKKAGYYMVYAPDEVNYAFMGSRTTPWIEDGILNFDSKVVESLEYSKELADNGYCVDNKDRRWTLPWTEVMAGTTDEQAFCFFGATWFVPWSLMIEETDLYGEYRVVEGPAPYYWGGSYILATDKCTNPELAELILETLCCDEDVMYDLYAYNEEDEEDTYGAINYYEFPNNQKAVENLIKDGKGSLEKLGGQDPLPIYDKVAKNVSVDYIAIDDDIFFDYVNDARLDYMAGDITSISEAIEQIKTSIAVTFPDIKIPE